MTASNLNPSTPRPSQYRIVFYSHKRYTLYDTRAITNFIDDKYLDFFNDHWTSVVQVGLFYLERMIIVLLPFFVPLPRRSAVKYAQLEKKPSPSIGFRRDWYKEEKTMCFFYIYLIHLHGFKFNYPVIWRMTCFIIRVVYRILPQVIVRIRLDSLNGFFEPRMFITGMVWHEIQYYLYACRSKQLIVVCFVLVSDVRTILVKHISQAFEVCHRTEQWINPLVVWYVVTKIVLWRFEYRRQPYRTDVYAFKVFYFFGDSY